MFVFQMGKNEKFTPTYFRGKKRVYTASHWSMLSCYEGYLYIYGSCQPSKLFTLPWIDKSVLSNNRPIKKPLKMD